GSHCHISDNIITDDFYGIRVRFAHDNVIQNNDLQANNGDFNIYLYCTNHSLVQDNRISNPDQFTVGITSYCCSNDTIRNNTINSTFSGMLISATTDSIIEANRVTYCLFLALELDHSPNNTLSKNLLVQPTISSRGCDIEFTSSPGCVVEDNTLYSGVLLRDTYPITLLNDLVQGKPLVYFDGKSDETIDYPCGQIILVSCRNITIQDQHIAQTVCACSIEDSDGCTLLNNTLSGNGQGITCGASDGTTISENAVLSSYDFGIIVDSSNNCTVDHNIIDGTEGWGLIVHGAHNTVTNNEIRNSGFIGFNLEGQHASIDNNSITDNNEGLYIRFLSSSDIGGNTFQRNRVNGLSITESSGDTFAENRFAENGYGMILGISCTKLTVRNNEFKSNQQGLLVQDATDNDIIQNNFVGNTQDASFHDAFLNRWSRNYWDRPRLIKIIWGTETVDYGITFKVFRIDWRPSLLPHHIPGVSWTRALGQ
ncbi:MAG TPA: NosD domain-containing protein, partial [Candidatus Thermoplasmatota archaeon]|nr:NosD domain-containing protein [Candidatus Thermoplasmatota archaeon]